MAKRVPVPKTRCAGTLTEAAFRSWIRSQLRRMSQRWKPIYEAKRQARREATVADKARWGNRIKYVYGCAGCGGWFPEKLVAVDHIEPCGSLIDVAVDAGPFLLRLLCEMDGLRILCDPCHQSVTQQPKRKA